MAVSLLALFVGITWAAGELLWQDQLDLAGRSDYASVVVVQDMQVLVAGNVRNSAGELDWLVRAYDTRNGDLLWQSQFDLAGGFDYVSGIAVEGRQVFVAGFSTIAAGNHDWVVQALDARDGSKLWQDQFDLSGGHDISFDIAADRGRAYVVGSGKNTTGNSDWIVRAYQAR
ncbi:MAG: PQQ-binding-like beta-propeller repeat protein [Chloroflexi bacterium]|nr:PQQ-binding-like beta-propeller repeat protein [Chloroflexota bacterium]